MNFERELLNIISRASENKEYSPLYLGGYSGPYGGSGGPPGGFIGHLPQSKVAFDTTELEDFTIPASGASLLHNLNRIRYRISVIESDYITSNTQFGGDVSGNVSGLTVIGIQNNPVTSGTPSIGDSYVWDGASFTPRGVVITSGNSRVRGDIIFEVATSGPVLTDRATGTLYRLYVYSGTLGIEPV